MKCWEFTGCGQQPGGRRTHELGVCPAVTESAGQACWLVTGTHCNGEVQGSFARKLDSCLRCSFYQRFDAEHRRSVRLDFAHLLRRKTKSRG